jgi:predicted nucleic acid-binding protein
MKTKNKARDAAAYPYQRGEPILIDANIWLYLLPPASQPTPSWAAAYSGTFSRLLQAKAQPVVDALILSEYLNRYVRLEYDAAWKTYYPKFKDFRQSVDATSVLQSAVAEVGQILKYSAARDTLLEKIDMPAILGAVQSGTVDFNDGLLIENCRLNGWKLLTSDGDMTVGGIEVLTCNKKLLNACP